MGTGRRAHTDRYAHLRPGYDERGRADRSHYQADGTPKKPLTEEQARVAAQTLAEREGRPVNAYECPVCGPAWHVGKAARTTTATPQPTERSTTP